MHNQAVDLHCVPGTHTLPHYTRHAPGHRTIPGRTLAVTSEENKLLNPIYRTHYNGVRLDVAQTKEAVGNYHNLSEFT